jgi:hypothetical protein
MLCRKAGGGARGFRDTPALKLTRNKRKDEETRCGLLRSEQSGIKKIRSQ